MLNNQKNLEKLLAIADIKINGSNPWDIQVKNPALYNRVLIEGSLGLGESYMDGWWECKELDQFFYHLLSVNLQKHVKLSLPVIFGVIKSKLFNLQAVTRAFEVGQKHYDLGHDFFEK